LSRRVLLTALRENQTLSAGVELASRHGARDFVISPELSDPDIVLYLEYGYLGLTELPLLVRSVRAFPSASHFLFSEADWPFAVLPGAYPSLNKSLDWAIGWSYLPRNRSISDLETETRPRFLFSFLGRAETHPVRKKVLLLDGPDTPCVNLIDAPKRLLEFNYSETYTRLIRQSRFILCPRGFGASSIRIFEAMSLGRVPVIISDEWRCPPGIDWRDFCIFVRESKVLEIPKILRSFEADAERMGRKAKNVFDQHFCEPRFFQELLTVLLSIQPGNSGAEGYVSSRIFQRAWKALSLREIRSVASQIKTSATFG
jgi:hypothetical protein